MKRQLGTALSVLGLLAVGTAAAAVNVRMLQHTNSETARFELSSSNEVGPFGASASDTATMPLPNRMPGSAGSATAVPGGVGPRSVGAVSGGHEGFNDGDRQGFDDPNRPQLTDAQMTLLRVSAMVRMEPQQVRAVARGEITDAGVVAEVKQAAAAIGVTFKQLAAVGALPPMHDRGHGGPGERRGFAPDAAAGTQTYDD